MKKHLPQRARKPWIGKVKLMNIRHRSKFKKKKIMPFTPPPLPMPIHMSLSLSLFNAFSLAETQPKDN